MNIFAVSIRKYGTARLKKKLYSDAAEFYAIASRRFEHVGTHFAAVV